MKNATARIVRIPEMEICVEDATDDTTAIYQAHVRMFNLLLGKAVVTTASAQT